MVHLLSEFATFSHEYIHAHVRELLAAILWPVEFNSSSYEDVGGVEFQSIADKYNRYLTNNNLNGEFSSLDCLAFSIIRFYQNIEFYEALIRSAELKEPAEVSESEPKTINPTWIRETIQQPGNWKLLNELMVHVLDYHYFYDGNNSVYLPVLWESWSTVPQVRGNLNLYIYRTLASLCSATSNSEQSQSQSQRFQKALGEFQRELLTIKNKGNGTSLIDEALVYIEKETNKNRLKSMIIASIGLIDDIMSKLLHPSIHSSVIHDPITTDENSYPFDRLEFSGAKVSSPVLSYPHE